MSGDTNRPTDTMYSGSEGSAQPQIAGAHLRDWFAGQVLPVCQSSIPFKQANSPYFGVASEGSPDYLRERATWAAKVAADAYLIADAMMKVRGK